MKRSAAALALLLAWAAGLAVLGLLVERRLDVGSDLRLFLPTPATPEQRLLLEAIGEGPASRLLVVTLDGAPPEALAAASSALVDTLGGDARFRFAANGDVGLDSLPEALLPYRYLLSADAATRTFDRDTLRAALDARARDLASPGGFALEPLIARDPTLLTLALLERWQPAREPRREYDVWFDAAGTRALLVAETRAPAFDPAGQREALAALDAAFASTGAPPGTKLTASGAGSFSVLMEARTRSAAERLARFATLGMVLVLLLAYRRFGALILSALPLASAGVAGLAAVGALFGSVHGITLAFGFTLLGVAQDYPLHLLSHRRPGVEPHRVAAGLWPTLATGVASTCIAYLTFWFSGVTGLQQLACFTVTGLAVAGLTTRYLLPRLMTQGPRDYGDSPALQRLWRAIAGLPRPLWAAAALVAACVGVAAWAPQPFWSNDLSALTPVPEDLLERDRALRAELEVADTRHLLAVEAASADAALTALEALEPELERLVADGAIDGYDHAARYVPSPAAQRARQAELPDAATLRTELDTAALRSPFRAAAFAPFLADVEAARTLPPLTLATARTLPAFGSRLDALLAQQGDSVAALVTLSGVHDVAALEAVAERSRGVTLLDVRAAAESLVAEQRTRMLWSLAAGGVLLVAIVAVALRDRRRVLRVLAPLALTTLLVVAALQAAGVSLNLFHLISLILTAGLGLDYALFFEHAADDAAEQARTLHAVLACSASTFMVFALLATTDLPVLRAIGAPVALGVVTNFVLALLLTRGAAAAGSLRSPPS
jgi:predicted exporter